MKYVKYIGIIIISMFCHWGATIAQPGHPDWHADLEFLKSELPARHIDLFRNLSKQEFERLLTELDQQVYLNSEIEVRMALQRIFAKIGDAHTTIELGDEVFRAGVLPIHLYWFNDGFYILHTLPEYREVLGSRLDSINAFPIGQIVDSLKLMFVQDGTGNCKALLPRYVPLLGILQYFGFSANDSVHLSLLKSDGGRLNYKMTPGEMNKQNREILMPDSLNFIVAGENAWFDAHYFEGDSILYVLYNKCWSRELAKEYGTSKDEAKALPSFEEFENGVMKMVKRFPFKKFVFDLRYNRGGNSSQGTALIEKLAKLTSVNSKGKLFVVIGRRTFSSAVLNALDFKTKTSAIFIGETAGGAPNHFGEVKTMVLPSSKLKVSYSTKYFKRTDSNSGVLAPDIIVPFYIDEFKAGKDPVYDYIKLH